jgi:hypothetical protein
MRGPSPIPPQSGSPGIYTSIGYLKMDDVVNNTCTCTCTYMYMYGYFQKKNIRNSSAYSSGTNMYIHVYCTCIWTCSHGHLIVSLIPRTLPCLQLMCMHWKRGDELGYIHTCTSWRSTVFARNGGSLPQTRVCVTVLCVINSYYIYFLYWYI